MSLIRQLIESASIGPVCDAEIFPATGQGRLRATYNWLYSSLNCHPGDTSSFVWRLAKLGENQYSLSPRDPYNGRQLYASVRDDIGYRLQVQAPYSADWITAVGRDEYIALEAHDLLLFAMKGQNGQYICADSAQTSHDGYSSYLVHSLGSQNPQARLWFMGIVRVFAGGAS